MSTQQPLGFLFDDEFLTAQEGEHCKRLLARMAQVSWARKLVKRVNATWTLSTRRELKSFLFELQIADEIWRHGFPDVAYECPSVGGSSIDFRVQLGGVVLLLEAVSSKVSDLERTVTRLEPTKRGVIGFEACFSGDEPGSEMIRVQWRIGEKVVTREGEPLKFPIPDSASIHAIAIDMRCYMLGTGGDFNDYRQIAYGPRSVLPCFRLYTGGRPVVGLWESPPQRAAPFLRERVHFIVFCNRKTFDTGLFQGKDACVCYNPHMFPTYDQAASSLARIPLFSEALVLKHSPRDTQ